MLLIDRYMVRSLVPPVLGVCVILGTVMLVFYSAQYLAEAVAEQHPLTVVLHLALMRLAIFLDVLLPAALCLGIIIGLGQLYASYEVTALMAGGGSPLRLVTAVLVPALLLAALVAYASIVLRPAAFQVVYDAQAELAVRVDPGRVDPGRFVAVDNEWMVYAESRSDSVLHDVLIQRRSDGQIELLRAGRLHREESEGQLWLMLTEGVHTYQFKRGGDPRLTAYSNSMQVMLEPPSPFERQRLRRACSLGELIGSDDPDHIAEWQWRLIAPISTLLLALAAVPMSRVNPRHGRGARILSGTLLIVIYFSLLGTAIHWVETERVPEWPGAWWVPGLMAFCLLAYLAYGRLVRKH